MWKDVVFGLSEAWHGISIFGTTVEAKHQIVLEDIITPLKMKNMKYKDLDYNI